MGRTELVKIAIGSTAHYTLLRLIADPDGLRSVSWAGDLVGAYREFGTEILALAEEPIPDITTSRVYLPRLITDP